LKIKNRHFLKSGDIKKLKSELEDQYHNVERLIAKGSRVETGVLDDGTIVYFVDGNLSFFTKETLIIPFLRVLLQDLLGLPKITVDMGAVPYVARGADVMAPGIVAADEAIKKEDFVVIVDENHNKPLAIGISLRDAGEILKSKKGKAVTSIHYVGDRMWDFEKNLEGK
jgi:PUA domain protein